MVLQSSGMTQNLLFMWSSSLEKSTKVCISVSRVGRMKRIDTRVVAGVKGRAAFCQTPAAISKEKRKETDYSEYPLTRHGEMLYALVQSGISAYPHKTVAMQFFETAARYGDFFKVRKDCIVPTLEAMVDARFVYRITSSNPCTAL